jgi:hypothetical protein
MATEAELRQIVKNQNGGEWVDHYGPMPIGTASVYEIWTRTTTRDERSKAYAGSWRKGDIPQTRFFLEDENGKSYFDYFCDLAGYLDKSRNAINAPAHLTVRQLLSVFGGLQTAQGWAVLLAICTVFAAVFYAGAKLGHWFCSSVPS